MAVAEQKKGNKNMKWKIGRLDYPDGTFAYSRDNDGSLAIVADDREEDYFDDHRVIRVGLSQSEKKNYKKGQHWQADEPHQLELATYIVNQLNKAMVPKSS